MILFKAEGILASRSSKFGQSSPAIDREDFDPSTDSTISTSLGSESSQSRTIRFLGRTLTLRQWRIEYEPDKQHVSRALKSLGLTDAEGVATPGTDDVGGPKASQISELRRTAKWHDPPEEAREEDDLLTREELKLFQSVAARFNFLAMDRPDLLYSVEELMRKMASPRTQDLTALKRVARYTVKYPRMTC